VEKLSSMKTQSPRPLLLSFLLLAAPLFGEQWTTLTHIDDELVLEDGETAMIIAVSEPSYLRIIRPGQPGDPGVKHRGVRIAPPRQRVILFDADRERPFEVEVSWNQPYALTGPCTVALGSATSVTIRHFGG